MDKIKYFIPKGTETVVRLHGSDSFVMHKVIITYKDVYMEPADLHPVWKFPELDSMPYLVFAVPYDPNFEVEYMAVESINVFVERQKVD